MNKKCKVCGGEAEISNDGKMLVCGYCGNSQPIIEEKTFAPVQNISINNVTSSKLITLVIILITLIMIIGIILCVFLINNKNQNTVSQETTSQTMIVDNNTQNTNIKKPVEIDLTAILNDYLSDNNFSNDISIAVYDNIKSTYHLSDNAHQKYVAWGLYLPIYLAYSNLNADTETMKNILSSDPLKCNNSANQAIINIGGLQTLNWWIKDNFNTKTTNYGRMFGDVNSAYDNYSSVAEALEFLIYFNTYDDYKKLNYNILDFNVYPPANANIYAMLGTENKNKLECLNFFAIVKGQRSNYCVAIMTKNYMNEKIPDILSLIHNTLECA